MSTDNKFCHNCGAPLVPGAAFCAKCGTSVASMGAAPPSYSTAPPSPGGYPPYRYRRYEKQEKHEKHEKNEKNEKGGRGSGGIIGPIVGGLILIWLGITFYLRQINYLPPDNWWAYFIVGIGAILILQGFLLYGMNRRPFIGPFIGGAILLLVGLSFISGYSWGNLWPLIFVVIGVAILVSSLAGRRRTPVP